MQLAIMICFLCAMGIVLGVSIIYAAKKSSPERKIRFIFVSTLLGIGYIFYQLLSTGKLKTPQDVLKLVSELAVILAAYLVVLFVWGIWSFFDYPTEENYLDQKP